MIDKLDKIVIQELIRNGREVYSNIAKKLGVVEGTIRKRVKRLTNTDVIKIVAVPNAKKLGYGFVSIVGFQVRMEDLRKVADTLAKNPLVCYLAFVTGRYDLMAIVLTQSPEQLSHFIEKEISGIPSILRTETFVNLDIIKGGSGMLDTARLVDGIEVFSSKISNKPNPIKIR